MGTLLYILTIAALTLVPFVEIQASIPYGLFVAKLSWPLVVFVAVVTNILVSPIAYFGVRKCVHLLCYFPRFHDLYHKRIMKVQREIHPYVERWGIPGIALFMASPLPGNGVYSTTLAAHALGMRFRTFIVAIIVGVVFSASLLTAGLLTGKGVLGLFG